MNLVYLLRYYKIRTRQRNDSMTCFYPDILTRLIDNSYLRLDNIHD
jgi:hypothetical protein